MPVQTTIAHNRGQGISSPRFTLSPLSLDRRRKITRSAVRTQLYLPTITISALSSLSLHPSLLLCLPLSRSSANMFDEKFSFLSSHSNPPTEQVDDCTSADISPFTSRCSSPHTVDLEPGSPKSVRSAERRDSRFDSYRPPRQPSITALTARLQSQALTDSTDTSSPSETTSPIESSFDLDEGFYDGSHTPATTVSDYSPDVDPTLWDLSMSDLGATSSPRPSLSLAAQALSSFTMRRRQRQALVRLQCLASRAPDLAMLIEECHPSSLPLQAECPRDGKGRSNSASSMTAPGNGRIEKDRTPTATIRRLPRIRKRTTP